MLNKRLVNVNPEERRIYTLIDVTVAVSLAIASFVSAKTVVVKENPVQRIPRNTTQSMSRGWQIQAPVSNLTKQQERAVPSTTGTAASGVVTKSLNLGIEEHIISLLHREVQKSYEFEKLSAISDVNVSQSSPTLTPSYQVKLISEANDKSTETDQLMPPERKTVPIQRQFALASPLDYYRQHFLIVRPRPHTESFLLSPHGGYLRNVQLQYTVPRFFQFNP